MPRRRSDAEQRDLYKQWQQSGLSGIEFCKRNSISSASIWRWQKKFSTKGINNISNNMEANNSQDLKFYPISKIQEKNDNPKSIARAEGVTSKDCLLELTLPKGINCKIHLSEKSITEFLYGLLK